MSITMTEKIDSRRSVTGTNANAELVYTLTGTDDDQAAKAHAAANAPAIYGGLVRQNIEVDPECVDEITGSGRWTVTVRYGLFSHPEIGESSLSFDTGGSVQHITQSLQTIGRYPPAAPDFKGAIGVTNDNVEGIDINVPAYHFSETHYLSAATVSQQYRMTLFNLTGKSNNSAFKGFAAGECLFLGAGGSKRGNDDWEITYRFAASPNRTNFQIGDITVASKKGWEYLWVRYGDSVDNDAKAIVKRPVAVYIEKIYEEANLALLGIGT